MKLSKYIANHLPCKIVYYVGIRMYTSSASSTDYACTVDYFGTGTGDYNGEKKA